MIKTIISTILIFFTFIFSFSQNVKTYKVSNGIESIQYSYFENSDLTKVKHGLYSYTKTNPSTVVKGSYVNGLKDGIWTWNETEKNIIYKNYYNLVTTKIIKSYNKGKRNGKWYSKTTIQTFSNGKLENVNSKEISEEFKNNIQVGTLIYKKDNKHPITINFNNKGQMVGKYRFPFGAGDLFLDINSNGVVTNFDNNSKDITLEAIQIGNDYSNNKSIIEEVKSKGFDIQEKSLEGWVYDVEDTYRNLEELNSYGIIEDDLIKGYFIHAKYDYNLIRSHELKIIADKEREIQKLKEQEEEIKRQDLAKINKNLDSLIRGNYKIISITFNRESKYRRNYKLDNFINKSITIFKFDKDLKNIEYKIIDNEYYEEPLHLKKKDRPTPKYFFRLQDYGFEINTNSDTNKQNTQYSIKKKSINSIEFMNNSFLVSNKNNILLLENEDMIIELEKYTKRLSALDKLPNTSYQIKSD